MSMPQAGPKNQNKMLGEQPLPLRPVRRECRAGNRAVSHSCADLNRSSKLRAVNFLGPLVLGRTPGRYYADQQRFAARSVHDTEQSRFIWTHKFLFRAESPH